MILLLAGKVPREAANYWHCLLIYVAEVVFKATPLEMSTFFISRFMLLIFSRVGLDFMMFRSSTASSNFTLSFLGMKVFLRPIIC